MSELKANTGLSSFCALVAGTAQRCKERLAERLRLLGEAVATEP